MGSVFKSQPPPYQSQQEAAATSLGEIGGTAQHQGKRATKLGMKSLSQLFPYFKTLLSGDRTAMTQLLAPELKQVTSGYDQATKNISEFGGRGGGTASALAGIEGEKAGAAGDIFLKARPYAAQGLQNVGGILTGAGTANLGTAAGAYGNQANTYANIAQLIQQEQARRANALGGIGRGAGSIIGSVLSKFI